MENHHFQWENPLQMAIFNSYVTNYQRVDQMNSIQYPMSWTLNEFHIHLQMTGPKPPGTSAVARRRRDSTAAAAGPMAPSRRLAIALRSRARRRAWTSTWR